MICCCILCVSISQIWSAATGVLTRKTAPSAAKSSYRRSQHADAPIDPPFDLQQVAPSAIEPATASAPQYAWSNNDAAKNLLNSLTKGAQATTPDHTLTAADNAPPPVHYVPVLGKTTAAEFEAQQLANTFNSFALTTGSSDPFSGSNYEAPSTAPASGNYGAYMASQAPPTQPQAQAAVNTFASTAFPGTAAFGTSFGAGFPAPTDVSAQPGYDAAAQAFSNFGQDPLKQQQAAYAPIAAYNMQYQQMGASAPAASTKASYGQSSSTPSAPYAAAAASSSQSMQQALPAGLPAPVYPNQAVSTMPPGLSGYNAVFNPYGQQFNPGNPYANMQYQNMYNMAAYGYQVRVTCCCSLHAL